MNQYDTDLALATFRSGVADPDLFLVHAWRGTEGVSQLYRFEIELASAQDDIDLSALLGSRATLTLRSEEGELMPWHDSSRSNLCVLSCCFRASVSVVALI